MPNGDDSDCSHASYNWMKRMTKKIYGEANKKEKKQKDYPSEIEESCENLEQCNICFPRSCFHDKPKFKKLKVSRESPPLEKICLPRKQPFISEKVEGEKYDNPWLVNNNQYENHDENNTYHIRDIDKIRRLNEDGLHGPVHLRSDVLENMLFSNLGKNIKNVTNLHNNVILHKPSPKTRLRRSRRHTSAEFIKEFLGPADTPVNARLFGGKKGVQFEIERAKRYGYVIHPCSKLRQYWDLLIMAMLVLNMMVLPLDIAFFDDNSIVSFHVISDTLCMIDIILNFRTGYRIGPERHEFELGQKKIAIHYLKTWFTLDLISSLPLHYILLAVSGQNVTLGLKGASRALKFLKVAKLLNLLKLLRLSRIIRGIAQYEEVYCMTTGFVRYIKLVCMMLMVAHWNGCLHFLVPMLQDFPEQCWVKLCGLVHEVWYIQYGWALFKTLSHMLCIGYGRFIPALLDEALITIFSMVTGATFYALFVAHSMAFIIRRDSSKSTYQEKIKQIEEYMQYRNIPIDTMKRISNYFEHKYHQGRFFDEQAILSVIGKPLREEIVLHTCKDLVKSVPFLKAAPPHFVTAVLHRLTFDVYLSGDTVIKEGTTGEDIYFVRKGCLDVSVKGRVICQLKDGAYFGDICMLTDDTRHIISVEARSTCDLFALSYKTLENILQEHPNIRPTLEQAALNRLINIHQTIELANAEDKPNSPRGSFKTKPVLNRQSSLNQLKEILNNTVENLAEKIKNFKGENDVIREKMLEESGSVNESPLKTNKEVVNEKATDVIDVHDSDTEEGLKDRSVHVSTSF